MARLSGRACAAPRAFSASALSRNAPSTTIVSPAARPERTSTSPPRSRPRPICADLERARVAVGQEDAPARRRRAAPRRPARPRSACRRSPTGSDGRRRHARPQQPVRGCDVDPHGDRARLASTCAADHASTVPVEVLARQRREASRAPACPRAMRTASRSNACTVSHSVDRSPMRNSGRAGSSIWPRSARALDHGARDRRRGPEDSGDPMRVGAVFRRRSSAQRAAAPPRRRGARRVGGGRTAPLPGLPAAARCARRPGRACAPALLSASVSLATAAR